MARLIISIEKETTNWIGLAVINAGSVNNKSDYLKLYIQEKNIDICCISETCLKSFDPDNQYECKNIIPNEYVMHHRQN